MKILLTGACGFVGSIIAKTLKGALPDVELFGIDNFSRPGSETNRVALNRAGVRLQYGDIRSISDVASLPEVDWVIDCAANPSVLAGLSGYGSSRQLVEHNLGGTINLLEFCKRHKAGFILLSTSRVYSIPGLAELSIKVQGRAYVPSFSSVANAQELASQGISARGVSEEYSTSAPVSLYGASKIASEIMALEYGATFGFPVWINRCGVLAGAGQFGRPDQGIFSYWINSWARRRPLRYIGFDGKGHQVRDCLHPKDLATLLTRQLVEPRDTDKPRVVNVAGGAPSAMSLRELSDWCAERFGVHNVDSQPANRAFDIPWMVLDATLAHQIWGWSPSTSTPEILEEIANHAEASPTWLETSGSA